MDYVIRQRRGNKITNWGNHTVKRMLAVVLALAFILICLTACGGTKIKTDDNGKTVVDNPDKTFIMDVSKAIQARWKITDADSEKTFEAKSSEEKNALTSYIDAELDILAPYASSTFKDAAMQTKAANYVKALETQKSALDYLQEDRAKFLELFSGGYDQEKALLKDFVDNYNLSVAEEYQERLASLIGTAAAAAAPAETTEETSSVQEGSGSEETAPADAKSAKVALDDWASSIAFKQQDDGSYAGEAENTTGKSFNQISLLVILLDADGNEVGRVYPTVDDLASGSTGKFTFKTDTKFASTNVSVDFYDEKTA